MPAFSWHLVCYDYGQGGVWAYVSAASKADIERAFLELLVVAEPPDWLTPELSASLERIELSHPTGLLRDLLRARESHP